GGGPGGHETTPRASNRPREGLACRARAANGSANTPPPREGEGGGGGGTSREADGSPGSVREELQRRCWAALGLERDGTGLADLQRWLEGCRATAPAHPRDRAAAEDRNLLDVAWAMAASARFREESRGSHYRLDFPRPDDRFRGHTMLAGGVPRP